MKHLKSVMLLLFYCHSLNAQWYDDFASRSLENWRGDTSQFNINNERKLQLFATGGGVSTIYRRIELDTVASWRCTVELQFSPSASNKLRIYLMQDTMLASASSGYFVEIGENGNTDRWRLFSFGPGQLILLGQGEAGRMAFEPILFQFMCTRKNAQWFIEVNYGKDLNDTETVTLPDSSFLKTSTGWFGIQCIYTATRADKFLFDDIQAGKIPVDTTPPEISNINVIEENKIALEFNEDCDPESIKDKNNYYVDSIGKPDSIIVISHRIIRLHFAKVFEQEKAYQLNYSGIKDTKGNLLTVKKNQIFINDLIPFPGVGDLVINEIMPDPEPAVGLPAKEYIEILNRSKRAINIAGVSIGDASSVSGSSPGCKIEAGQIVIICRSEDTSAFKSFGRTIGLIPMPSLNNEGDEIYLYDRNDEILDKVIYSVNWHTDDSKKQGGYSLELNKPNQACKGNLVWSSSLNASGGTPGRQNSLIDTTEDRQGPQLVSITPISEWEIRLIFDEPIDKNSCKSKDIYNFEPMLSIAHISIEYPEEKSVVILLNDPLEHHLKYHIKLSSLKDCSGNTTDEIEADFGIPEQPKAGDIGFNEILFNPYSGSADYLELFNKTNNELITGHLYLKNSLKANQWTPVACGKNIEARSYLVLTADVNNIRQEYPIHDDSKIVYGNMVPLDDDEGFIHLGQLDHDTIIDIDSVHYFNSWHNSLISNEEGVALEKIIESGPSNDKGNWTSAAKAKFYGSPGLRNSQNIDISTNNDSGPYTITNKVISPNNDGFRDILLIEFHQAKDSKSNIRIYDPSGNLVSIVYQDRISPNENVTWTGLDSEGKIVRSGNYILDIVLVYADGTTDHYKTSITVDSGK
ncbi:MAG: lamin tail domain-containing protein [Saprospiraceae bacterium]